jgi:transcriptional regulator with XRE-family HTH domain
MGRRLQRLRETAGFSQPQLAKAANIPVASLRNWEQDRRIPRFDAAVRIAIALGISLDQLAGIGSEAPTPKKRGQHPGKLQ